MEGNDLIINLLNLGKIELLPSEQLFLSKDNIKYSIDSCIKKHLKPKPSSNQLHLTKKTISDFMFCLCKSICPNEYQSFLTCMKSSKGNLSHCLTEFQLLSSQLEHHYNISLWEFTTIKL